jgi:hypothetical protein
MYREDLAEARERTQEALSRARLTTDPGLRDRWLQLAVAWYEHLAAMEAASARIARKPPSGRS